MELAYHTARSEGSGTCFCMNGLGTDLPFILERIVEREAAYARRMRKRSDSPETRYLCHGVQWLNNHSFCGHIMIEPDFSSVPVLDRREHDREIAARLILDAMPSMPAEVRIAIELIELNLSNGTAMPLFHAENYQIASSMPIWRKLIPPSEHSPETYGVLKAAMYILGLRYKAEKDGETNDCISA